MENEAPDFRQDERDGQDAELTGFPFERMYWAEIESILYILFILSLFGLIAA
jgi:hypothetical protein